MCYSFPVRSEALFQLLFEMNEKPKRLYPKKSLRVELAEPILNLVGWLIGKILGLRLAKWPEEMLLKFLAKGQGLTLDIRSLGALKKAGRLAEKVKQRQGAWPAILFLTTHAPTEGSRAPLRFSILYQIQSLLRKQFPQYPAPMKFTVAIDPFALSDLGWLSESFVAGIFAARHLAIDRQNETQGLLQRRGFFRNLHPGFAPFRLSRLLRERVPVGMVLPGALPQNARLLYTLRELIQRLKGTPSQELAAAEILARPDEKGRIACMTGKISGFNWKNLDRIFGRTPKALKREFEREFMREAPYRRRFFRFLIKRGVGSKGTPVLLIPVRHRDKDASIHLSSPRLLSSFVRPDDFAKRFVRKSFPDTHGS